MGSTAVVIAASAAENGAPHHHHPGDNSTQRPEHVHDNIKSTNETLNRSNSRVIENCNNGEEMGSTAAVIAASAAENGAPHHHHPGDNSTQRPEHVHDNIKSTN
ncbi:hypothetical protein QQF64_026715 [Cirrhinus molitorella]|uniref:Secreted protein n=1 Tax=Cirrhinus molitorella TaxID=172907 RepID=A0ABR3NAP6_9TELE